MKNNAQLRDNNSLVRTGTVPSLLSITRKWTPGQDQLKREGKETELVAVMRDTKGHLWEMKGIIPQELPVLCVLLTSINHIVEKTLYSVFCGVRNGGRRSHESCHR